MCLASFLLKAKMAKRIIVLSYYHIDIAIHEPIAIDTLTVITGGKGDTPRATVALCQICQAIRL